MKKMERTFWPTQSKYIFVDFLVCVKDWRFKLTWNHSLPLSTFSLIREQGDITGHHWRGRRSGADSRGVREDSLERWSLNTGGQAYQAERQRIFPLKEGEASLRK